MSEAFKHFFRKSWCNLIKIKMTASNHSEPQVPPQMKWIELKSQWKDIWLDGSGGCHCVSSCRWVSRLHARFCAVEEMSVRVQWADGIEATKAEIKGGCRLTHSGWVAVTKSPTWAQQCHRATLISSLFRLTLIECVITADKQTKSLVE